MIQGAQAEKSLSPDTPSHPSARRRRGQRRRTLRHVACVTWYVFRSLQKRACAAAVRWLYLSQALASLLFDHDSRPSLTCGEQLFSSQLEVPMSYETSEGKQLKLPVVTITEIDKKDQGCAALPSCLPGVLPPTRCALPVAGPPTSGFRATLGWCASRGGIPSTSSRRCPT